MKWFGQLLIFTALFNVVIGPIAQAQAQQVTAKQLAETRAQATSVQYNFKVDPKTRTANVYNADKKLVMEIPLTKKEELRKYSPKALGERMKLEMTRVTLASKGAWSHSMASLPTESLIFFMAMGAVVAGQLITNYAQNPVAMQQHLDHSVSPLGVFGFFTFMYSQGVTSNILSMYMKNPAFMALIPYLGMTVGAFLQTYLSSFASDPVVGMCAKYWLGNTIDKKEGEESCEKAYEYFTTEKLWEFTPGIASMLVSSALAAAAQNLVTKAVLRMTGVNIALWFVPGSMQLKGIRLLLVKGLQITAFVSIDALIMRKITYIWRNVFDGAEFYDQNDRLNAAMSDMKNSNWKNDEKILIDEVKEFREKMTSWRMMNMSEVYEAHQNWVDALTQMTAMYNTSYAVYNDTVEQVRKSRFAGEEAPLLSKMQLAGVNAMGLPDDKKMLYLARPEAMIGPQLNTAAAVGQVIVEILGKSDKEIFLYPNERKVLKNISKQLYSEDEDQVLAGIRDINKLRDSSYANQTSQDAIEVVEGLWKMLGNPSMPKGIGQGYFSTYEKSPLTIDNLKGTNYYRIAGAFQTPNITDYLVIQMLCGPDAERGAKVVRNSMGYPSVFAPPQMTTPNGDLFNCNAVGANLPSDQIYAREIEANGKKYSGSIPYLAENIRPSILGNAEKSNFETWWHTSTEKQMLAAFEDYSAEYQKNVAKLVKLIFEPGKSIFNGSNSSITWKGFVGIWDKKQAQRNIEGGPIMNGGILSAFQEERVYLALLEELMKPSKKFEVEFSDILQKPIAQPLLKNVDEEFKKLETLLRRIKVVTVNSEYKVPGPKGVGATVTKTHEAVQSDLENYELDEQTKKIQEALTQVAEALGVGDGFKGSSKLMTDEAAVPAAPTFDSEESEGSEKSTPTSLVYGAYKGSRNGKPSLSAENVKSTPFKPEIEKARRDLAVQVIEQLESLSTEIMMYGAMANAVSWEKIRDMKRIKMEREKFDNNLEQQKVKVQGVLGIRY